MVKAYQGKQLNPTFEGATFTGDITIGANKLIFGADAYFQDSAAAYTVDLRRSVDSALGKLGLETLGASYIDIVHTGSIRPPAATDNYFILMAQDTGVGLVEIARLQGAADPYFQATLPMVLNASGTPGALVAGHFWFDTTTKLLKFYDGTAVKTVTSA